MVIISILIWLFCIALILSICVCVGMLSIALACHAVNLSKISLGLLLGLAFFSGSFGSFLFWAAICVGAIYLLSLLPRVSYAIRFFSTVFISYLAVEILGTMIIGFLLGFVGKRYEPTITSELVIKAVCVIVSVYMLFLEIQKGPGEKAVRTNNTILVNIQRLLAAFFYGLAVCVICVISINNVWKFSETVNWCIFGGTCVLSYLADVFLLDKLIGNEMIV